MTCDCVERRLFVVELDAWMRRIDARHDFRYRRQIVGAQFDRRFDVDAARAVPFDDVAQIDKGDAGIFLQYPFGRDPKPRRPRRDILEFTRLRQRFRRPSRTPAGCRPGLAAAR